MNQLHYATGPCNDMTTSTPSWRNDERNEGRPVSQISLALSLFVVSSLWAVPLVVLNVSGNIRTMG